MIDNNKKKKNKPRKKPNKIEQTANEEDVDEELFYKFKDYIKNRRVEFLRHGLSEYFGKNFVINYHPQYNFQEEWEETVPVTHKFIKSYILEETWFEIGSSILMLLVYTASIMISTIDLIYRNKARISSSSDSEIYRTTYAFTVGIIFLDIFFKIKRNVQRNLYTCSLLFFCKSHYRQIYCLGCFCAKLMYGQANSNQIWIVFESISIVFLYFRSSKLYKSIRLISFSLYYEYHSKICDLIITLFCILNVNAIVLFLATFANYQTNWMDSIQLTDADEFVYYLYSLYFSSTTILTVGYGDISPSNPLEVSLIVLVQVLGIATFGYIINEIGYCISNLRKEKEIMEKDLSIVLKMRNHYNMDEKLVNQARSFIINNTQKVDELYPSEENYLMNKFNEELRNNLHKENALSIVKSSIFFLTRWSISFQKLISSKIEHILFNPNDLLYQPKSKERIYLIKNGKINVYADKNGRKKGQKNLLKIINNNNQKEIADNCYGYTAAISTRPSRLYAISEDSTSAYYLEKQKFYECMSQRVSDFEYYHEIKDKMDQSENWEVHEVPKIESSKSHFNPTKKTVINKHLLGKGKTSNKREPKVRIRNMYKPRLNLIEDEEEQVRIRRRFKKTENNNMATFTHLDTFHRKTDLVKESRDIINNSSIKSLESQSEIKMFRNASSRIEGVKEFKLEDFFAHFFQSGKIYNNYFTRMNATNILEKIDLVSVTVSAQVLQYEVSQNRIKSLK